MESYITESEHIELSVLYGLVFSLSLTVEYLDGAEPIISSKRDNYVANKLKEAYTACNTLSQVMTREFIKTMSQQNKDITLAAIEQQKQFVYDIFMMDYDDQFRIKGLIKKLKSEKQ